MLEAMASVRTIRYSRTAMQASIEERHSMFPQVTELDPGRYTARGGVRALVCAPVFKTGVSSDPAQAGSIPVRLR
jgi:hypothetical protein